PTRSRASARGTTSPAGKASLWTTASRATSSRSAATHRERGGATTAQPPWTGTRSGSRASTSPTRATTPTGAARSSRAAAVTTCWVHAAAPIMGPARAPHSPTGRRGSACSPRRTSAITKHERADRKVGPFRASTLGDMKAAILVAFLALLAVGSAQGTIVRSGLYGDVRRGPISPVCAAEQPCDAPAAGAVLVFSRDGREVARTKARDDGSYRVRLTAGLYTVRRAASTGIDRKLDPNQVRVKPGRFSHVDFSIDTGIR